MDRRPSRMPPLPHKGLRAKQSFLRARKYWLRQMGRRSKSTASGRRSKSTASPTSPTPSMACEVNTPTSSSIPSASVMAETTANLPNPTPRIPLRNKERAISFCSGGHYNFSQEIDDMESRMRIRKQYYPTKIKGEDVISAETKQDEDETKQDEDEDQTNPLA